MVQIPSAVEKSIIAENSPARGRFPHAGGKTRTTMIARSKFTMRRSEIP
jgi:hypothetical protein